MLHLQYKLNLKPMKNLLIIIVLLTNIGTKAQTNNFYLSDSKISWQKVYETSKSKTELMSSFTTAGIFEKKFKVVADTIFAQLKPHKTDPDKTGTAGVPEPVNKTDFKGLVTIYFKDKEYKVVFQNILLIGRGDFLKKKEEKRIEEYFVRRTKSEYTPGFLKKPIRIYDITFNEIFELK
jgi:hypothetical protein